MSLTSYRTALSRVRLMKAFPDHCNVFSLGAESSKWSPEPDSNRRPQDLQSHAATNCAIEAHYFDLCLHDDGRPRQYLNMFVVGRERIELPTRTSSVYRSTTELPPRYEIVNRDVDPYCHFS